VQAIIIIPEKRNAGPGEGRGVSVLLRKARRHHENSEDRGAAQGLARQLD
jgi:hypothetical protein